MHFIFGDTVDFTRLTWEAFATFLTGALAVGGAILIGLRQAAIQRRQVALQQLELRRLLFDQRLPVYEATRDWIEHVLTTGTVPNRSGNIENARLGVDGPLAEFHRQRALESSFLSAVERSRFVFSPHVFEALEQLWVNGNQLHYHRASQDAEGDIRSTHVDAEHRLRKWFVDQYSNLATVFGDELKVSDGGKSTFRPLAPAKEAP